MVLDVRVLVLSFVSRLRKGVHNVVSVFMLVPVFRILLHFIVFRIISSSHGFPSDLQVLSRTIMRPALIILSVILPAVKGFGNPS